ncbi:hypothetical protein FB45DRAFT_875109 [Roridomyces roridus]|uniref:Uncharacterized protein n=1 Tax=Roridomyces roridus TaxID=1738132 RepID=A0AAD7B6S8_9AGAR|nr:hypothetical protein FB45DRAFT_875109 [Roridomyces roridus]
MQEEDGLGRNLEGVSDYHKPVHQKQQSTTLSGYSLHYTISRETARCNVPAVPDVVSHPVHVGVYQRMAKIMLAPGTSTTKGEAVAEFIDRKWPARKGTHGRHDRSPEGKVARKLAQSFRSPATNAKFSILVRFDRGQPIFRLQDPQSGWSFMLTLTERKAFQVSTRKQFKRRQGQPPGSRKLETFRTPITGKKLRKRLARAAIAHAGVAHFTGELLDYDDIATISIFWAGIRSFVMGNTLPPHRREKRRKSRVQDMRKARPDLDFSRPPLAKKRKDEGKLSGLSFEGDESRLEHLITCAKPLSSGKALKVDKIFVKRLMESTILMGAREEEIGEEGPPIYTLALSVHTMKRASDAQGKLIYADLLQAVSDGDDYLKQLGPYVMEMCGNCTRTLKRAFKRQWDRIVDLASEGAMEKIGELEKRRAEQSREEKPRRGRRKAATRRQSRRAVVAGEHV